MEKLVKISIIVSIAIAVTAVGTVVMSPGDTITNFFAPHDKSLNTVEANPSWEEFSAKYDPLAHDFCLKEGGTPIIFKDPQEGEINLCELDDGILVDSLENYFEYHFE